MLLVACGTMVVRAQPASKIATAVPRLVKFSGTLTDGGGKPLTGVVGVTFSLYEGQEGGSPIWMETQNVQAGGNGQYTVLLGYTKNEGLPAEAFAAGQRWLGVQAQGEAERPRVLMASVPYSLKAVDAETLGGLPASAFALAGVAGHAAVGAAVESAKGELAKPAAASPAALSGTGTAGTVPLWTNSTTLGNSLILQSGTSVGIGATSTASKFVVKATSGNGIVGEATGATGSGVQGTAIDTSGANIGVLGTSESSAGVGVQGQAFASTGSNVGVFGLSESTSGIGVKGSTSTTSGDTFGVLGVNSSSAGIGVKGEVDSTSGATFGVYGVAASSSGVGIQGEANAASGDTRGVYGVSASPTGLGVQGEATATSGTTYGVAGLNASSSGGGVQGQANAVEGNTAGVYGSSASTSGSGVSGEATSTTGSTTGVFGLAASTEGIGVSGEASATTGNTNGVSGSAVSTSGVGVSGDASATTGNTTGVYGKAASPTGVGVYGNNPTPPGIGVYGVAPAISTESGTLTGAGSVGVWGDSSTGFAGVLGTADSVEAVAAYNNSTHLATLFAENDESSKDDAIVLATYGSKFSGYCDIFVNGNLTCSGSKSAVVPVDGGSRQVALYAVEAPENWFEDAGSGSLVQGAAVVRLEPVFAQTVNTGMEYHVFLTPKGDCKGLYVANETGASFEVHELGGGTSAIAFDYRIMARRKSYEGIRLADLTNVIQRGVNSNRTAPDKTMLQRAPLQRASSHGTPARMAAPQRRLPVKSRPSTVHGAVAPATM
jgi:hypothetical protein